MPNDELYIYDHPVYYDVLFGWDRSKEVMFVDQTGQKYELNGRRFLEMACGTGVVAKQMAFLGWDVCGLDLSQAMVDAMQKDLSALEAKTWAYCADMCDFELYEKFNLIYCPLGSIGLVHDENKIVHHLNCVSRHLADGGIYLIDVGLQKSLHQKTKPLDLQDLIWAMEVEGIYVEASRGVVKVEDDMKKIQLELTWDAVPLEFNFQHLMQIFDQSSLRLSEVFPQSGQDENGIPIFDHSQTGYSEGIDRAMMVLKKY